jgi:hypothetical protein
MTKLELQILFHRETGDYAPTLPDDTIPRENFGTFNEYISWLEEKLISLYNMP